MRAAGKLAGHAQRRGIDLESSRACVPGLVTAGDGALVAMDVSVPLHQLPVREPGRMKLPIDIRGHHEAAERHRHAPRTQDPVSLVRDRLAVHLLAMAVPGPGHLGHVVERLRLRELLESGTERRERRVGIPEPAQVAEIRQPGLDAHARAGRHQQRVGPANQLGNPARGAARVVGNGCGPGDHWGLLWRSCTSCRWAGSPGEPATC